MTTSDAQKRATRKFEEKTYNRYIIRLRKSEDADLIADIEEAKTRGISYRDYLKDLYQKARHSRND